MIDTLYFLAITFIFIRLTAFFLGFNILFPKGTPNILKGTLALIIGICIVKTVDYSHLQNINNNLMLIEMVINEIITGLFLGIILNTIFNIIKMAGAFMDMQAGLSMMSMLDPATSTNATLIANLTYMIGMVLFFLSDSHHIVLKLIVKTFNVVHIGDTILYSDSLLNMMGTIYKLFEVGIKIAIPFIIVLFITDLCMALVSRAVPAINVMMLGMPVKLLVGLTTFVLMLPIISKIIIGLFKGIPEILDGIFTLALSIPMIGFVASDEKTEEATPKKKSEARKKGQVPKSKEVSLALSMIVCILLIVGLSPMIGESLKNVVTQFLGGGILEEINSLTVKSIGINVVLKILINVLPIAIPIMLTGVVASIMQTGLMLNGEGLKPKFSKLNPISGFKNMFSKKSAVDLVKNLIVVSIVIFIGYTYLKDNYNSILQISNIYLGALGEEIKNLVVGICMQVALVLVVVAGIDYFIQFKFHNKELKMSKQEIKEEFKQMEGDPQVKGKIKQKQREMATKRMMQSVKDATVVITNPTHIAIAIKYDEDGDSAPIVVAKGLDNVALKIKEIGMENNVPIMENKTLARLMYDTVEVEAEIPKDMYGAVAEILAMVYKLKKDRK